MSIYEKCSACGRTPDPDSNYPQCQNPGCPYHGVDPMDESAWNAIHKHHNSKKPNRDSLRKCQVCHGKNRECPKCFGFDLSPSLSLVMREFRAHGMCAVRCSEIADALDRSSSWTSHKIKKLVQSGHLEKLGHGIYARLL